MVSVLGLYAPSFPLLFSLSPPGVLRLTASLCFSRHLTSSTTTAGRISACSVKSRSIAGMLLAANLTAPCMSRHSVWNSSGPTPYPCSSAQSRRSVIIVLFARFFARKRERLAIQFLVNFVTFAALYVAFEHFLNIYSDNFLIKSLTYPHFGISLIDREQVSNGNDLRVMVANIGARLWQLGKWILLSSAGISISKSPSPMQPTLLFPRPPHLIAFPRFSCDRRLFLISNGLTKFILH